MKFTPRMNETQQAFVNHTDDEAADELLVRLASQAMREKLAQKRAEGRGGWHTNDCNNAELKRMLLEHVKKGDPVDLMNFAAMLHVRQLLYGRQA